MAYHTQADDPSPSSSPVKTSDNFVKFADELAPLDSLPPGNNDSTLKKDLHEENFQEDVEIKNSNVSDKLIDDFLAMEVSSNLEEGYFDSEGDIAFLDNLLSDDDSHNLDSKGNFHQNSVIESLPISPIPVEDSEPTQEEIDIFLVIQLI
ncbi:hypothetical protein Tco_0295071 [Tanacetum coccineum]